MNRTVIKKYVEAYLNNETQELPFEFDSGISSQEKFELHTVKRLKFAFDLYKSNNVYLGDFMLALRNYLLIYEASIRLSSIKIPEDNDYSIVLDSQSGQYFASFQFPNYVNDIFARQAFLKDFHSTSPISKASELTTDPLIYEITGYSQFKSLAQKLAVYGALNTPEGYTTLVSLPTGGGKSLISQTLSYQKEGLTIIIVPTVSLAIDQVRVAKKIIHSTSIDNEIFYYSSGVDLNPILDAIKAKSAKMLFISPESLINNQGINTVIKEANKSRYLKNIIIDEAHIVVDWGASFRIDYQCLESWRNKLLTSNPSIKTILLSATYERHCISILKDFFSTDEKWIEIRCDSLRHEPRFMLINSKSNKDKNKKLIDLVRKLPHPMIIYVARPIDAENIKEILFNNGIKNVKTFTGLTTASKRKELIDQWVDDQFHIMVATSAFGVGVDKSDVRTVLHMYIPQNPNAYYQELGRGGRDKLPCLSIMCIHSDDSRISFQRVSKRVMTSEKILGRWDSMYNSQKSTRIRNWINIDTSIRPNYNVIDSFDDSPTTDADMNWNIYILLLLRRYNLIRIEEVLPQNGKYIFVIEILDNTLRTIDSILQNLFENIRNQEWSYHNESFQLMNIAIRNSKDSCWSEMFYETYDKVSEFCAGCNSHTESIEGDFYDFPLKLSPKTPIRDLAEDQLSLFGRSKEVIIFANELKRNQILDVLLDKRLSLLIASHSLSLNDYFSETDYKRNLFVIDRKILRKLLSESCYFYVSGLIAILYDHSTENTFNMLKLIDSYSKTQSNIKIIHILPKNIYFESQNKMFSDLVDGIVLPTNVF